MPIGDEIQNLVRMRDEGILSDDEFVAAKARLLSPESSDVPQKQRKVSGVGTRVVTEWRSRRAVRLRILAYLILAIASITAAIIYSHGAVAVEPGKAATARAKARNSLVAQNKKDREQAAQRLAIYSSCRSEIGPLLSSLGHIDARLDVGLNFQAYSDAVGDASVKYHQISFGRLDTSCTLGPGVAAENAFNAYIRAYNKWNSCIGDLYCSTDSIEPDLQSNWSTATSQIARARRALNALLL